MGWGRTTPYPLDNPDGLLGDHPYAVEESSWSVISAVDGARGYVEATENGYTILKLGVGDNLSLGPWNFPQWGFVMRFRINEAGMMNTDGNRLCMLRWEREGQHIGPYIAFGDRGRHPGIGIDPNAVIPPSLESLHYQWPIPPDVWMLVRIWFSMEDCRMKVWREDDPLYEPRIWYVQGISAKPPEEDDGLPPIILLPPITEAPPPPAEPPPPPPEQPLLALEQSLAFDVHVGNGEDTPTQRFEVDWWGYYVNEGAGLSGVVDKETVAHGDGSTTKFYTDEPFVYGTLTVFVSGLIVTPATVDPVAGWFTFDYPPSGPNPSGAPGALIQASYQVARQQ